MFRYLVSCVYFFIYLFICVIVGISTFVSFTASAYSTQCFEIDALRPILFLSNQISSTSMPGISISVQIGTCDAFGHVIWTLDGGSIFYTLMKNSSVGSPPPPSVVRTSFRNGTGEFSSILPVVENSWYRLESKLSSGQQKSIPSLTIMWKSSSCVPFYGFSPVQGCVLCSPSQYSIDFSLYPCVDCRRLSPGSSCSSVEFPVLFLPHSSWSTYSFSDPKSARVTVVQIESGYWPALSSPPQSPSAVVSVSCPFDYCFRSDNLYVNGLDSSGDLVTTSDFSVICRQQSHRDPSSPLCGRCAEGYVDWNYECYYCPNGPHAEYVVLFVFFVFGWTLVQLILAQQGGSGSVTAMLFFLTQSLTWFTYPRGVLHTVENLVNFRFHLSTTNECYIDVDGTIELFLRTLVPMLYFVALWMIYGIHISLGWCLSRQEIKPLPGTAALGQCQKVRFYLRNLLISTATADPYQRTTALLFLSTFPSILDAIFSVWTCMDVPVCSSFLCSSFWKYISISSATFFLRSIMDRFVCWGFFFCVCVCFVAATDGFKDTLLGSTNSIRRVWNDNLVLVESLLRRGVSCFAQSCCFCCICFDKSKK